MIDLERSLGSNSECHTNNAPYVKHVADVKIDGKSNGVWCMLPKKKKKYNAYTFGKIEHLIEFF